MLVEKNPEVEYDHFLVSEGTINTFFFKNRLEGKGFGYGKRVLSVTEYIIYCICIGTIY